MAAYLSALGADLGPEISHEAGGRPLLDRQHGRVTGGVAREAAPGADRQDDGQDDGRQAGQDAAGHGPAAVP